MAAPSPRDAYVQRASRFCRQEFGATFRFLPCARALTESGTPAEALNRLLCVSIGNTGEEVGECTDLLRTASVEDLRKRFGGEAVDAARAVGQRAVEVLSAFVPPEGRVIAPMFPTPTPTPAPAPPPVAPTPAVRAALASEVLTCLAGTGLPPRLLDAVVGAVADVEARLRSEEQHGELCHQLEDVSVVLNCVVSGPEEERHGRLQLEAPLAKLRSCLCVTAPTSLLDLLVKSRLMESRGG